MAYSAVATESDSFQGSSLWLVTVFDDVSTRGWDLPDSCRLFSVGMETDLGTVEEFKFGSSLELYGITDEGKAVLLDVPEGTGSLVVEETAGEDDCPVQYVDSGALDRLDGEVTIRLPASCVFDYSLFGRADWHAESDTLAATWLLNCELADALNGERPAREARIVPDLSVIAAASVRADELLELYDSRRPDGSTGWDLLDERSIHRKFGGSVYSQNYDDISDIEGDGFDYVLENYGGPLTEEDSTALAGKYYDRLGMAWAEEDDGQLSWFCYLLVS